MYFASCCDDLLRTRATFHQVRIDSIRCVENTLDTAGIARHVSPYIFQSLRQCIAKHLLFQFSLPLYVIHHQEQSLRPGRMEVAFVNRRCLGKCPSNAKLPQPIVRSKLKFCLNQRRLLIDSVQQFFFTFGARRLLESLKLD